MAGPPTLQIALDGDLATALSLIEAISPFAGMVEIGTPLIFREGMNGVRAMREAVPEATLLADLKIMDAGAEEASIAFAAGADFVTVLGVAHPATVEGALASTAHGGGRIMVDMMRVPNLEATAAGLLAAGCHALCVHTAYDVQESVDSPYRDLELLRSRFPDAVLAIAGGVTLFNLDRILPYRPDIIVVGGAITRAVDPAAAVRRFLDKLNADDQ